MVIGLLDLVDIPTISHPKMDVTAIVTDVSAMLLE
jgi:hypothetical protein